MSRAPGIPGGFRCFSIVLVMVLAAPAGIWGQTTGGSISAGSVTVAAGGTATVPITLNVLPSIEVLTLSLNVTVVPVGAAPVLPTHPVFTRDADLPPTSQNDNSFGCCTVLIGWFSDFSPTLTGSLALGTVSVEIAGAAQDGNSYQVQVLNASGTNPAGDDLLFSGVVGSVTVHTPTWGIGIDLGKAAGRPGGLACLTATLAAGGAPVVATRVDIGLDPRLFSVGDCVIYPVIGPGTAADKQLSESALAPGLSRVTVWGANPNLIPNGTLYTCPITIGGAAGTGTYSVSNTPSASDPSGVDLNGVGGRTGQVVVTTCAGDCDGSGRVSIGEVVRTINHHLGDPLCNATTPALSCPGADVNANGVVSIGEVVQVINQHLAGSCP